MTDFAPDISAVELSKEGPLAGSFLRMIELAKGRDPMSEHLLEAGRMSGHTLDLTGQEEAREMERFLAMQAARNPYHNLESLNALYAFGEGLAEDSRSTWRLLTNESYVRKEGEPWDEKRCAPDPNADPNDPWDPWLMDRGFHVLRVSGNDLQSLIAGVQAMARPILDRRDWDIPCMACIVDKIRGGRAPKDETNHSWRIMLILHHQMRENELPPNIQRDVEIWLHPEWGKAGVDSASPNQEAKLLEERFGEFKKENKYTTVHSTSLKHMQGQRPGDPETSYKNHFVLSMLTSTDLSATQRAPRQAFRIHANSGPGGDTPEAWQWVETEPNETIEAERRRGLRMSGYGASIEWRKHPELDDRYANRVVISQLFTAASRDDLRKIQRLNAFGIVALPNAIVSGDEQDLALVGIIEGKRYDLAREGRDVKMKRLKGQYDWGPMAMISHIAGRWVGIVESEEVM